MGTLVLIPAQGKAADPGKDLSLEGPGDSKVIPCLLLDLLLH